MFETHYLLFSSSQLAETKVIDTLMKISDFDGNEYDKRRLRYSNPAIKYIKTRAGLSSSSVMLDLACGTGIVLREFLNDVNKIVGLDASWSMLEFQRKSNNTINDTRLVMADGNCTPFSQGVFDVVILGHAIHWFNLELLLPEIHRLLKPGGWLVVISRYPSPSTPYRPLCHYILEKFKNKNTQSACLVDLNDIGSGHIVGIEKFGFSKYSRVVIESEDIIPVKTYVERVSDNDIYWTLVDDEKRNLLKELEDALFELSENGIIHEMNFDYILTAQKNTPY